MFSGEQQNKRTEESNSRLGITDISAVTIGPTLLENPEEEMFPWVQGDEEHKARWRDCKAEINNMQQSHVPTTNKSLFDLAKGEELKISQSVRDNKLPTDAQLNDQFPQYAPNIKGGLTNAIDRYQKIFSLSEQLQPADIDEEFPSCCVEKILDHLPNQILENVITCIKPQKEEVKAVSRITNSTSFDSIPASSSKLTSEKQQLRASGSRLHGSTLLYKAEEQQVGLVKQKEMAARCHR